MAEHVLNSNKKKGTRLAVLRSIDSGTPLADSKHGQGAMPRKGKDWPLWPTKKVMLLTGKTDEEGRVLTRRSTAVRGVNLDEIDPAEVYLSLMNEKMELERLRAQVLVECQAESEFLPEHVRESYERTEQKALENPEGMLATLSSELRSVAAPLVAWVDDWSSSSSEPVCETPEPEVIPSTSAAQVRAWIRQQKRKNLR